jgi:cardiolipin synthase
MGIEADFHYWILPLADVILASSAAVHALLNKSDSRAALGWVSVCIFFPLLGPITYFLLGINRVRTRARALNRRAVQQLGHTGETPAEEVETIARRLQLPYELAALARASAHLTGRPALTGNRVELLENGDRAYPAMLEAIDGAEHCIYLTSYLFQTDSAGRRFIRALGNAAARGVDVRVILDGVGELFAFPRTRTLLKRRGVRVARFIPPRLIPPAVNINLRNHRKILVVDGRVAFTGGMNISQDHAGAGSQKPRRITDVHFRLGGPVVSQIDHSFLVDWGFITGEKKGPPELAQPVAGPAICRVVTDGPVMELDKLATLLVAAVATARHRVVIVTPYFLPSAELEGALISAALRGVDVHIVLPSKNNHPLVHWASRRMLPPLLLRGVHVAYQPPPFAHTKLLLVDRHYALMGSANIDPRSLRLNFELGVELYGEAAARDVAAYIDGLLGRCWRVTVDEIIGRGVAVRLRDASAWLMSPYL